MHTRGSQLVPELSDTLHIQYRYIEHVHEDVHEELSCKKKKKKKKKKKYAYAGNSTCTTACAETIQYFAYTI